MMKTDINFTPPRFAALIWTDRGNGTWCDTDIDRNPGFWRWWAIGRWTLPRVGVYVTKIGDEWAAIFDPRGDFELADVECVIAEIRAEEAKLPRLLFDGEQPRNDAEAKQSRIDKQSIASSKRSVERGLRIQADARALLDEWGDFTSDLHGMREILSTAPTVLTSRYDADAEIRAARRKTEKRAQKRLVEAQALPAESDLEWTDDEVRRAVKFLTSNDGDHASVANDRGWSSSDSAAGHWCAKMLTDPEHSATALQAARSLVGKYCRQLVTAGVIYRDRFVEPRHKARKAA
jgi:hypothetical protein